MPSSRGAMHKSSQGPGVCGSAADQPDDNAQDDQCKHCDPKRLVDEQHLRAQVAPRQLRRPHAERERDEDQQRHQPVEGAQDGIVDRESAGRRKDFHRQAFQWAEIRGSCRANATISRRIALSAVHASMIATARVQPAEARSIFIGKHETMKPVEGSASRLCSFSRWQ